MDSDEVVRIVYKPSPRTGDKRSFSDAELQDDLDPRVRAMLDAAEANAAEVLSPTEMVKRFHQAAKRVLSDAQYRGLTSFCSNLRTNDLDASLKKAVD
ncbi:uncharacterized protein MYCGRDRAFT_80919, partial [Zymoseptoria tritici IPO323]